jgi:hypothetical protein
MLIRVNLSEWNSRLHRQSPPARTKGQIKVLKPTEVGFACVAAVSNRPFCVKLTRMSNAVPLLILM